MLWRLVWWTNQLTGGWISRNGNQWEKIHETCILNNFPLQLWERPRLQEFRGLSDEDCKRRGLLGYIFFYILYGDILSYSTFNQNVSSISFNEKLSVLRSVIASTVLTCLSTGSSLQGLSALLATHGAMVSNFLAFIWTGQTVHFNCGTLNIINHILLNFSCF